MSEYQEWWFGPPGGPIDQGPFATRDDAHTAMRAAGLTSTLVEMRCYFTPAKPVEQVTFNIEASNG